VLAIKKGEKKIVRTNIIIDEETRRKLDIIKSLGISTDTTAITMAIYHLAQHVEKGEVFVDKEQRIEN